MKATGADTSIHSVKEKSAEEAELLAVLRTFIYAKMKSSIRLMSFKMFKPRSQTISWKNMIKKEAAEKNMTLGQLVQSVMHGEGFFGIARRYLPSYIGNALSSLAVFSTYNAMSPYSLLVSSEDETPHDGVFTVSNTSRQPFARVFANVFPYGFVAGCAHACVSIPAKTVLSSHYAGEPLWLLLQPATSSTLSPSMGCVVSGGDYTRSGLRHLRQLAATPMRVPSHLASTILAQRMWGKKWTMPQDSLGFAFFFATYEAVKQSFLPQAVSGFSRWRLEDSEVVVSASTAFVAGLSAGAVYGGWAGALKWRSDFQVSMGKRMMSNEFARHLSSSVLKQSLPNAASFLVIELLMHYLNLK